MKDPLHKNYYQVTAIDIPKCDDIGETYLIDKMSVVVFTYDTALEAMAYMNSVRKHKTLILIRQIAVFNDCTQYNYKITEEKLVDDVEDEIKALKETFKPNEG